MSSREATSSPASEHRPARREHSSRFARIDASGRPLERCRSRDGLRSRSACRLVEARNRRGMLPASLQKAQRPRAIHGLQQQIEWEAQRHGWRKVPDTCASDGRRIASDAMTSAARIPPPPLRRCCIRLEHRHCEDSGKARTISAGRDTRARQHLVSNRKPSEIMTLADRHALRPHDVIGSD